MTASGIDRCRHGHAASSLSWTGRSCIVAHVALPPMFARCGETALRMSTDRQRLPPLNALRAFDAAARHRSFRAAADELLVTPQAISQQVKILEDALGIILFDRKGRSIELTDAAIVLANFVENGLREFAEGVRRVTKAGYADSINLNVSPYFATRYLISRLNEFQVKRPHCRISLTTIVQTPQFGRDDVDVAIQWGYGNWRPYDVHHLLTDVKVICCAPRLLEGPMPLEKPADLRHHKLLQPLVPNSLWPDLLQLLGVTDAPMENGITLQDAATMRFATIQGLGVGLLSIQDAINEIRDGTVVAPFGTDVFDQLPEEKKPAFYLIYPRSHNRIPAIAEFIKWIKGICWSGGMIPD